MIKLIKSNCPYITRCINQYCCGIFRLLELQSSGRKNVLRVIYRAKLFSHESTSRTTSSSSVPINPNHLQRDSTHFHDIIFPSSCLHSQSSFLPTSSSSSSSSSSSDPSSVDTKLAVNVVENIPLNLADNKWHKLSVGISGNQLQVFLDCK